MAWRWIASLSGSKRSSEESQPTQVPRQFARAVFRAAAVPPFSCRMARMRGSLNWQASSTWGVSSVEPSSTTTASQSGSFWAIRLFSAATR